MNGVHDMGGMHGFGPMQREDNEPVFHELWEGRVYGIARAVRSLEPFGPGGFRFAIESLTPAQYLASSYYERWLLALEKALVQKGILTEEELEARTQLFRENPDTNVPRREAPELAERIMQMVYASQPLNRDIGVEPRYAVGGAVKARNINPSGHTRLPRYVRGKRGIIARFYGVHDFPDVLPDGSTGPPQPIYSVRFEARELWGEDAESNQSLYIDMWESYLEPDTQQSTMRRERT
jgi:nitrile hydratase subunit beta